MCQRSIVIDVDRRPKRLIVEEQMLLFFPPSFPPNFPPSFLPGRESAKSKTGQWKQEAAGGGRKDRPVALSVMQEWCQCSLGRKWDGDMSPSEEGIRGGEGLSAYKMGSVCGLSQ